MIVTKYPHKSISKIVGWYFIFTIFDSIFMLGRVLNTPESLVCGLQETPGSAQRRDTDRTLPARVHFNLIKFDCF